MAGAYPSGIIPRGELFTGEDAVSELIPHFMVVGSRTGGKAVSSILEGEGRTYALLAIREESVYLFSLGEFVGVAEAEAEDAVPALVVEVEDRPIGVSH